ncbi:MAG: LamG-like jellyroll fold domain-containing protein [Pseudooceanicola nanhaiensis]
MAIRVSSLDALHAALAAKADGVILLEGGEYGDFVLEGQTLLAGGVIIASLDPSDPAIFSGLSLEDMEGLTFESVTFSTTADIEGEAPFEIVRSSDVTILNATFESLSETPPAQALLVRDSTDIVVEQSNFDGFAEGVVYEEAPAEDAIVSAETLSAPDMFSVSADQTSPSPDSEGTVITVNSITALHDALATATGGETILLEGGEYGGLGLSFRNDYPVDFPSNITIASADPENPAVFDVLRLDGVSNLTFDGIKFDYTYTDGDPTWERPFTVLNSTNVTIVNSVLDGDVAGHGYATGVGLFVDRTSGFTLSDSELEGFHRGLLITNSSDVAITGNDVHSIRSDGFDFAQIAGVLIENNYLHDFAAVPGSGDHRDMIQFWTNGTTEPSSDIVIRGNRLDIGDGDYTQSIFMRNDQVDQGLAGEELYYQNVLIEENVITNGHTAGIILGAANGATIRNNTVLHSDGNPETDLSGTVSMPKISVNGASHNVVIDQNIAAAISGWTGQDDWTLSNNAIVQDSDPSAPGYYGDIFIASSMQPDGEIFSPIVLPGSILDLLGAGATVTQTQLDSSTQAGFHVSGSLDNAAVRVFDAGVAMDVASLPEGTTFTWHFGEETVSGPRVSHAFPEGGFYPVTLEVALPDNTTLSRSILVGIEGPAVLRQTEDGFAALGYGSAHAFEDGAVEAGVMTLGAAGLTAAIGNAHVREIFEADDIEIGMNLTATGSYSGGEILRIHGSLVVGANGDGEITVSATLEDGSSLNIVTSGAGLTDMASHDVILKIEDSIFSVIVDGTEVGSKAMSAALKASGYNLDFGNAWGKSNFDGELRGFSIDVDTADYAAAAEADPEPAPVFQENLLETVYMLDEQSSVQLGDWGTQASLDRLDMVGLLRSEAFEVSFDLDSDVANSGGEIFRLHGSLLATTTPHGDLLIVAESEDGSRVSLRSSGTPFADAGAHHVALRYEQGQLYLVVDDTIMDSTAFSGLEARGGRDLVFGNPWGGANFDGTLSNFTISLPEDAPVSSFAEAAAPESEAIMVEATSALAPDVEAGDPGLSLVLSETGTAGHVDGATIDNFVDGRDFDISFSLQAAHRESLGEVFRLHKTMLAKVGDDGDLIVRIWAENGTHTTLMTQNVNFGDRQVHDVAFSYSNGRLEISVDGHLEASKALSDPLRVSTSPDLIFGNPWGLQNFEGAIFDFEVTLPEPGAVPVETAGSTLELEVQSETLASEELAEALDAFAGLEPEAALAL